jgi:hypothetical protein
MIEIVMKLIAEISWRFGDHKAGRLNVQKVNVYIHKKYAYKCEKEEINWGVVDWIYLGHDRN